MCRYILVIRKVIFNVYILQSPWLEINCSKFNCKNTIDTDIYNLPNKQTPDTGIIVWNTASLTIIYIHIILLLRSMDFLELRSGWYETQAVLECYRILNKGEFITPCCIIRRYKYILEFFTFKSLITPTIWNRSVDAW